MTAPRPLLLRRTGASAAGVEWLIRPASTDDAAALVTLVDAVASEDRWILGRPGDTSVLEQSLLLAGLLAQGGVALTLQVGGVVAGQLMVQRGVDEPSVGELAVVIAAAHRRSGHGRRLLDTAVDWARAVRLRSLSLSVFADNHPAIALYTARGFVDAGPADAPAGASVQEGRQLRRMTLAVPR